MRNTIIQVCLQTCVQQHTRTHALSPTHPPTHPHTHTHMHAATDARTHTSVHMHMLTCPRARMMRMPIVQRIKQQKLTHSHRQHISREYKVDQIWYRRWDLCRYRHLKCRLYNHTYILYQFRWKWKSLDYRRWYINLFAC